MPRFLFLLAFAAAVPAMAACPDGQIEKEVLSAVFPPHTTSTAVVMPPMEVLRCHKDGPCEYVYALGTICLTPEQLEKAIVR